MGTVFITLFGKFLTDYYSIFKSKYKFISTLF
nr:MAG TPA_asm: hypothetical protein [Caudoviricetes sp.]